MTRISPERIARIKQFYQLGSAQTSGSIIIDAIEVRDLLADRADMEAEIERLRETVQDQDEGMIEMADSEATAHYRAAEAKRNLRIKEASHE